MSATHTWINAHTHPLGDLSPIMAAARESEIVGVGETTRESAEIDAYRTRLVRELVEHAGYRVVVIPDSANVADKMDEYVSGKRLDLRDIVLSGWLPNRTRETENLIRWIRTFNESNPDVPVRIVGNAPRQVEPRDYDDLLHLVADIDTETASEVDRLYATIRTAHEINEHIQIHEGIHPGRPFSEIAQEALDTIQQLDNAPGLREAVAKATDILDYHGQSVAGGIDLVDMGRRIADRVVGALEEFGEKVVYFDGFAMTGSVPDLEAAVQPGTKFPTAGQVLRDRLGERYLSVLFAFGGGAIRDGMEVPPARLGSLERDLLDSGVDEVLLDVRDGAGGTWPDQETKVRIIAGIYDPDEDERHYSDLHSVREAVDFIGFVKGVSDTESLNPR
ncbi:erythromycin esterase family protein [Haloglycomyces albus]|uniref:erythromycin esterase family protein n=1 Tax=Haloglycomyces albus TaxID=526067 RepID=UPI00046D16AD|nr:erythromycin esterase family protein [Haloglycomyces albus]